MDNFADLPEVATTAKTEPEPEAPKLNCDVTISIRDNQVQPLKVRAMNEMTYQQVKEVLQAGVQQAIEVRQHAIEYLKENPHHLK